MKTQFEIHILQIPRTCYQIGSKPIEALYSNIQDKNYQAQNRIHK
jgi:hypothetical protein